MHQLQLVCAAAWPTAVSSTRATEWRRQMDWAPDTSDPLKRVDAHGAPTCFGGLFVDDRTAHAWTLPACHLRRGQRRHSHENPTP